ncbi:MAG: hypothetical protein ACPGYX_01415 [Oceanobacter sp.]
MGDWLALMGESHKKPDTGPDVDTIESQRRFHHTYRGIDVGNDDEPAAGECPVKFRLGKLLEIQVSSHSNCSMYSQAAILNFRDLLSVFHTHKKSDPVARVGFCIQPMASKLA